MGKLINVRFNPDTEKLERVEAGASPVFNNNRKFEVDEAFDIIREGYKFYVPVEAYEIGFEDKGLFKLEVELPTIQEAMQIRKGSIVEL